ncbi:hypothetical protein BC332_34924 [Capsicum chinense]|nr:hypothetical protein BC332_34924 [Capsicum chinense]
MSLGVPSSPLLPPRAGYRVKRDLLQPCNVRMGSSARHLLPGVGAGVGRASTEHLDARRVSYVRHVRHYQVLSIALRPLHFVRGANRKVALASLDSYLPRTTLLANDGRAHLEFVCAPAGRPGSCDADVDEECYLVDPSSSHMLVSKINPCMCKYEQIQTVKL